jgi:plasmid maintenance system antidote protein VapI
MNHLDIPENNQEQLRVRFMKVMKTEGKSVSKMAELVGLNRHLLNRFMKGESLITYRSYHKVERYVERHEKGLL